ncbi:MAG TPA: DMT family transporter [Geminicoccaceae bacterium]|nr:DMT family transporter [Geminicoccaceae bacterium]
MALERAKRARALPGEVRGILIMLLGMALFGLMDGATKFLAHQYAPTQILWLRFLFSVPLMLVVLAPRGIMGVLRSRAPWLQLLRTVLMVVEMGLVVWAFGMMPLADAHAILAICPLVITALSVPMLGERVGMRRWLAVLVGFLGVLLIVRPGAGVMSTGAVVALVATVLYAFYQVLTRIVGRVDRAETSLLLMFGGGAVLLSFVGPVNWRTPEPWHWPFFLSLAVLGTGGHYCVIRALQLAPAVVVQPFSYAMLIWAVLIGWLVFGDFPDAWTISGALVIAAAGIYSAIRQHRLPSSA